MIKGGRMLPFLFVMLIPSLQAGSIPDEFKDRRLIVAKPLSVAPQNYHVLFQGGMPITPGQLTVWDPSCRLELKNSKESRWQIDSAIYQITGYKTFSSDCDQNGCDEVSSMTLKTINGPEAYKLDCRVRHAFGEPGNTPGKLTIKSLGIILGDYITVK